MDEQFRAITDLARTVADLASGLERIYRFTGGEAPAMMDAIRSTHHAAVKLVTAMAAQTPPTDPGTTT